MKAMVCEMCNGNDLVKQDGMFVCQHCGTKYSIEEAKKLMIEGTVDVQGTVKVDNTDAVEKYLINARRAKQKEDWKEAERYYNLVEQDDPSNIEAIFYSAYASAKQSLVENDIFKRKAIFNSFNKSVSIIDDYYDINNENSFSLLCQITDDIFALVNSSFTYTKTTKNNITTDNKNETYALFHDLIIAYANTLYAIEPKYAEDKEGRLKVFKLIMHCCKTAFNSTTDASKKIMWNNNCITCSGHIKALDPSYDDSFLEAQKKSIKSTQRANTIGLIAGIAVVGAIIGLIVFFVTM